MKQGLLKGRRNVLVFPTLNSLKMDQNNTVGAQTWKRAAKISENSKIPEQSLRNIAKKPDFQWE